MTLYDESESLTFEARLLIHKYSFVHLIWGLKADHTKEVLKQFRNYFHILVGVTWGQVWVISGEAGTKQNKGNWDNFRGSLRAHNCSTFGCKFLPVTQSPHQTQIERLNVTILWKYFSSLLSINLVIVCMKTPKKVKILKFISDIDTVI